MIERLFPTVGSALMLLCLIGCGKRSDPESEFASFVHAAAASAKIDPEVSSDFELQSVDYAVMNFEADRDKYSTGFKFYPFTAFVAVQAHYKHGAGKFVPIGESHKVPDEGRRHFSYYYKYMDGSGWVQTGSQTSVLDNSKDANLQFVADLAADSTVIDLSAPLSLSRHFVFKPAGDSVPEDALVRDLTDKRAQPAADAGVHRSKQQAETKVLETWETPAELALLFARRLELPASRCVALQEIALALMSAGDQELAKSVLAEELRVVDQITFEYVNVMTRAKVAEAFLRLGEPERALAILKQLQSEAAITVDPYDRSNKLLQIADVLLKAGDTEQARSTAEQALHFMTRSLDSERKTDQIRFRQFGMVAIATKLLEMGDKEAAIKGIEIALQVANGIGRNVDLIANAASVLRRAGKESEATELMRQAAAVAESMQDKDEKSNALTSIAEAHANSGDETEALRTLVHAKDEAGQILTPDKRATALNKIATIMERLGDAEQAKMIRGKALEAANRISDPQKRAFSLQEIAHAYSESGEAGQAASVLQLGEAAAAEIDDTLMRSIVMLGVADAYADAGEEERGLRVIASLMQGPQKMSLRTMMHSLSRFATSLATTRDVGDRAEGRSERRMKLTFSVEEREIANQLVSTLQGP